MDKKMIVIPFDYSNTGKCLSYVEVQAEMKKGVTEIHTNCLDFFSFNSLDHGYDVRVEKQNGDYILLSELLGENPYTRKIIRQAHNVHKLLIANAFDFKAASSVN